VSGFWGNWMASSRRRRPAAFVRPSL